MTTKTKRVKIALAINAHGDWNAVGAYDMTPTEAIEAADCEVIGPMTTVYWVLADIPIPQPREIEAVEVQEVNR